MDKSIVLDQPDQIYAFFMLQIYYKLKLEVEHPNGPKWRDSPAKQAVTIMDKAGVERSRSRYKKNILAEYKAYLEQIGVLSV